MTVKTAAVIQKKSRGEAVAGAGGRGAARDDDGGDSAVGGAGTAGGGGGGTGGSGTTSPPGGEDQANLHEIAQTRYLNYALSVITSRALPDVRDGMKPVQRRILFTMWQQNLTADVKHRKCAKVVGDVMGSYRSEEHTSELQSLAYLVCRLLLEK